MVSPSIYPLAGNFYFRTKIRCRQFGPRVVRPRLLRLVPFFSQLFHVLIARPVFYECLAAHPVGYGTNGVPNPPYIDYGTALSKCHSFLTPFLLTSITTSGIRAWQRQCFRAVPQMRLFVLLFDVRSKESKHCFATGMQNKQKTRQL